MGKDAKLDEQNTELLAKVATLESQLAAAQTERESFKSKVGELEKSIDDIRKASPRSEEEQEAEFRKSLPASVRARLDKQEKEVAVALEKAERLEKQHELDELAKTARKDFSYLVGTAEEQAELLYDVRKALKPEQWERLVAMLKAANGTIHESGFFDQIGRDGKNAAGSALQKLEQMAEAIRKGEPTLSKEAAFSKAMDTPDGSRLYAQYQNEKSSRVTH